MTALVTTKCLMTFVYVSEENKYVKNPHELIEEPNNIDPNLLEIINGIKAINEKNAKINSVFSQNLEIVAQQKVGVRLNGEFSYEKDKNFRFKMRRGIFNALELDLGSNSEIFWFWSKRMKNPGLYWSKHEDTHKTRLKTPFHPLWIMESMGVNHIVTDGAEISKFNNLWKVTRKRRSTLGHNVMHTTLIDPEKMTVVGNYVSSLGGDLISSSEIKEWNKGVPSLIVMRWNEENAMIRLRFIDIKINHSIPDHHWEKPNRSPEINMAK